MNDETGKSRDAAFMKTASDGAAVM